MEQLEEEINQTKRIKMKTIFINAKTKEVTQIDAKIGLEEIYRILDVRAIEVAFYLNGDCCYIDDEGRINGTQNYFYYNGLEFAGNGLIVGTTKSGGDTNCESTIEQIKELISFPEFIHEEWAVRLFNEKGIPLDAVLNNGNTVRSVLDFFSLTSREEQDIIKSALVKIDFANGDVLHFMNYLADAIPD